MRRSPASGFTLIEVLIAIAILSIITALVAGSFAPLIGAKETVEAEADRYHGLRLAIARMSREVSMAYLSDRFDPKRFRERPTHFVGDDSGNDDKLRFTTLGHVRLFEDAKESDQSVVEYRVGRDPDRRDRNVLFRREKTVIDDQPDQGGNEVILAEDIEGLDFQYWDVKKKEWVSEWDTNDMEHKNHLPERVRITLVAKDEQGKERKYTTQARVFLKYPLGKG